MPKSISNGFNVEKTTLISKDAQNNIQKKQNNGKKELKKSIPSFSISEFLSKFKLSRFKIPKSQVSKEIDLSNTSLKDMINLSNTNLATDDLSKIDKSNLNLNLLSSLGFNSSVINEMSNLIINQIKLIDNEVKNTNNTNTNASSSSTYSSTDSSTTQNTTTSDESGYNQIDQYSKKRGVTNKKITNSKYSVDKRNRTDSLDSSKAVSTKKRTISYKDNPNYGNYY